MSESKIACPHCDQHILLDDAWAGRTINCPACQKPFEVPGAAAPAPAPAPESPPTPAPAPAPPAPAAGLRINRASATPPQAPAAPSPSPGVRAMPGARAAYPAGRAPQPSRTSGLAIASLILSIVGCFGLTAIAAVICGHMARKRIRNDASLTGGGMALAGLIIGYLMLALSAIFGTLFTVGFVKGLNEARRISAEMQSGAWTNGSAPEGMVWSDSSFDKPAPAAPEGAVSGNIKGDVFTYTKSSLATNMGLLSVSDGEGFLADRDVKIFLFSQSGESLENRTWKISPATAGTKPHVHLRWQENGNAQSSVATSGYTLELKTGAIENGVISGSLDLKVTGKTPAVLKGNFTAVVE